MTKDELDRAKSKRVLCAFCKAPIHIDDYGGEDKEGSYHTLCIIITQLRAELTACKEANEAYKTQLSAALEYQRKLEEKLARIEGEV